MLPWPPAMPMAARVIEMEAGRPSPPEYAGLDLPQLGDFYRLLPRRD